MSVMSFLLKHCVGIHIHLVNVVLVIRAAKGWNISSKFLETLQKSQKVSKIHSKFPKFLEIFQSLLEIVQLFTTLLVIL